MNIHLAALGWVPDAPIGNRLRWHYPTDAIDKNHYLGLPETIIVERAWVKEDLWEKDPFETDPGSEQPRIFPYSWWDTLGDVNPVGFLPTIYILPWPAQAVHFLYQGSDTRMVVINSHEEIVADQKVANGQVVRLYATDIKAIKVFTLGATFHNFMALNLFCDHDLQWEEIARIRVADTVTLTLQEAGKRYDLPPTLSELEWAELVEAAVTAQTSNPQIDEKKPDEQTKWGIFQMMMAARWEHAVLFGHGFFDGPRQDWGRIDEVKKDMILHDVPSCAVAYRVRDEANRLRPSNMVICAPSLATPLITPNQPAYKDPKVQLTFDTDTNEPKFVANYSLQWTQPDPLALGVEIKEEISASPTRTVHSAPVVLNYICRTRQPEDPRGGGLEVRSQDVAFHDVQLRCCVRAIDGWDRTSAPSAFTSLTSLELCHDPAPPNIVSATWNSGAASLIRQVNDPNFPNWAPDLVVQHDAGARIFVYRRKTGASGRPNMTPVIIEAPVLVSNRLYRATVTDLTNITPFEGGYVVAAPFKAMICKVTGYEIFFEIGSGDSTIFGDGKAELQQNPLHLDLWDKVAEFDAHGLPETLTFTDPVPSPGETADVLSYHTRVAYLGTHIGPPSNTVQALRMPTVPSKPPPFTVELLGVDFYNRTMVKICFTNPVSDGKYTVWWANGTTKDSENWDFAAKAVPGIMCDQALYNSRYLYDVLTIPLPQTVSRKITVGVQRVTDGGGQSDFETVEVVLPTLTSSQ